jgi:hypothetical protein
MENMLGFFERSWSWVVPCLAFIGLLAALIRNVYAAERDRQALKELATEREKLRLEIAMLKNSPEARKERRAIYDRLRSLLSEVISNNDVSRDHFFQLGSVRHDSEFGFPPETLTAVSLLAGDFNAIYVARAKMSLGQSLLGQEQWDKFVDSEAQALISVDTFFVGMPTMFKPFLAHP